MTDVVTNARMAAAPAPAGATPLLWTKRLPLVSDQLWDLMWRREGQREWLGPASEVLGRRGSRCVLSDEAGAWRTSTLVEWRPGTRARFLVQPGPSWSGQADTEVSVDVTPDGETGSRITIEETGVDPRWAGEVNRFWTRRLQCLDELVGATGRRRASIRQAVIVIHGIGEQEPGVTLSQLARSGVLSNGDPEVNERMWVKPDRVSGSYELRRITLSNSETRPMTDVFEFYWAHVIRDTTLFQIGAWLKRLLGRWRVPAPLRPMWVLAWAVIVMAGGFALAGALGADTLTRWFAGGTIVSAVASGIWTLIARGLAVDVIGDAARYLVPYPANIAHRQTIRKAGVDLVETLHASGRYDRIVILGHSLGSVIAYDIVTYAWTDMHFKHRRPGKPSFKETISVERNLDVDDPQAAHALQWQAWCRQRLNTQPWLVTDLVTVGSPLTYADWLMAATPEEFAQAQADRILPRCPPTPEIETKSRHRRVTFEQGYRDAVESQGRTFTMFHHAAPFAVTRWTNLYFKVGKAGLEGDLIGGPVAPHFGNWVRDVALTPPKAGFTHTWYWRAAKSGDNGHLEELRQALHLDARAELRELMKLLPASLLVDRE